jgi:general secretion pathway protein C
MKRTPLITSFILFIVLCASTAYWTMQFIKPTQRTVTAPPQAVQSEPSLNAAASLFGSRITSAVAGNIQLKGVVVAGNPAESVAILLINGKPAQTIRTNAEIMPGVTVKEVHSNFVLLSENAVLKRVDLPKVAQKK